MRIRFFATAIALVTIPVLAQQPPKAKSQKEVDALQKVQTAAQAGNYDGEIQAINYVIENFPDTAFKNMLLDMAVDAAQRKGDYAQTVAFGEQAIQTDPNDLIARVTLAATIAQHTRENDLDKEQSLKKVDDYANKALDLLKNSPPPPPGVAADKWPAFTKQLTGQAYDALGLAADLRKNYPAAIDDFKNAIVNDSSPVSQAHLAKAYLDNKQYDEAITAADKVLAMNDAPAVVKQFAQQQKDAATKLKAAK